MKNILLKFTGALAVVAALIFSSRSSELRLLANESAGVHANGKLSRKAESALSVQNLLVKQGTAADEMDVCGATDLPLGHCMDTPAVDAYADVQTFSAPGTRLGVASKAIAVGDPVYTAASGKLTDTSATGAFYLGRALTAADADGDEFEYDPSGLSHTAES